MKTHANFNEHSLPQNYTAQDSSKNTDIVVRSMQPFCPEEALRANPSKHCAMAEPCIADPFAEDFAFGNTLDVESFSGTHTAHSDHPTVFVCKTQNGRISELASHDQKVESLYCGRSGFENSSHTVPSALSRAPTKQTLATDVELIPWTPEAYSELPTVLACKTQNGRFSELAHDQTVDTVASALSRAPTEQTLAKSLSVAAPTHVANNSEIRALGTRPQVQKRLRQVVAGCLADSIDCVEATSKRPFLASSRVDAGDESNQSLARLSFWPETDDAITKGEVMRRAAYILSTVLDVHDSSTAPALQGQQREARESSYLDPHKAAVATQECTAFYSNIVSCMPRLRQGDIDTEKSEMFSAVRGVADSMSSYVRYLEFEALILRSKLERERMASLQKDKNSR